MLLLLAIGLLFGVILTKSKKGPHYVIKKVSTTNSVDNMYQVWFGKHKLSTWMTERQALNTIYKHAFTKCGGTIERDL
jgi:hypothetical protein